MFLKALLPLKYKTLDLVRLLQTGPDKDLWVVLLKDQVRHFWMELWHPQEFTHLNQVPVLPSPSS